LPDAFAHYDPGSCCWRTLQGSLHEGWARFSGTWPRSGTTRNGTAFRRPTSALRTFAAASSSSPTPQAPAWPTPTVSRSRNRTARRKAGSRHHDGLTLLDAVRLWPTPTRADAERSSDRYPSGNPTLTGAARWPTPKASAAHSGQPRPDDRGDLQAAVRWPTPTAQDGANNGSPSQQQRNTPPLNAAVRWPTPTRANPNEQETLPSFQARKTRERAKGRNGNGIGTPLGVAVRLWPTPQAHDAHPGHPERVGRFGTRHGGRDLADEATPEPAQAGQATALLNPAWVETLMGFPQGWTRVLAAGPPRQGTRRIRGSRPAPPAASPAAPSGSPASATPSSPRSPPWSAAGPSTSSTSSTQPPEEPDP